MVNEPFEGLPEDIAARIAALSPEKRALFELRLKQKNRVTSTNRSIQKYKKSPTNPLSFAQQRLWFIDQLIPESAIYNVPKAFRVTGSLNLKVLKQSINEIIRRHHILRTTFVDEQGLPIQKCVPFLNLKIPVIDLQDQTGKKKKTELNCLMEEEAGRPFDLRHGPLLRAKLFQLGGEDYVFQVVMHHIITDGWSFGIFSRELSVLYEAYSNGKSSPLEELSIQYTDFAQWQRNWLQGPILEKELAYWRKQLKDLPILDLPTDRPRQSLQTYDGAWESLSLPLNLFQKLQQLSQQEDVTLFMTLLTAFMVLLHRWTGQEDVVIGSPIAARNRSEIEDIIGFFVNSLVLRGNLSGSPTFRQALQRIRKVALGAYAHQNLPFEKLVEELLPSRDLSRTPLFQVLFNHVNIEDSTLSLPPLLVRPVKFDFEFSKFDISLFVYESRSSLVLSINYNTHLFEVATIQQLLGSYQNLLATIVADQDEPIATLRLMTDEQRQALSKKRSRIKPTQPFIEFSADAMEQSIPERFSDQVNLNPGKTAVLTSRYDWTYTQLDQLSDEISNSLIHHYGSAPQRIALLFNHDAPMIAALLGVLKADKTVVPLDPFDPQLRLEFILADTGAHCILTDNQCLKQAESLRTEKVAVLNIEECRQVGQRLPKPERKPASLAYILYTSGSTGVPKGVSQNDRNILHHIRNYTNSLHISSEDRLSLLSPYVFDGAMMDIFGALLNGSTLYPVDLRTENYDSATDWLNRHKITVYHSTATVYRHFVNHLKKQETFSTVRVVVLGGEEVLFRDLEFFSRHFTKECLLVISYGLTESTTALQYWFKNSTNLRRAVLPIGYPVDNTDIVLLDKNGETVDLFGEIGIRSYYVTPGYWGQPALNEEKFILSEEGNCQIFRTGDLGRRRADGSIAFAGRIDHQINLRGYRIEAGEIETVLVQHEGVEQAAIAVHEDAHGERRLVAYVVGPRDILPDDKHLRDYLKGILPNYMVPSVFVNLEALPLTAGGKANRVALPRPEFDQISRAEFSPPTTETEQRIAEIWQEVLEINEIGVHDDFFALGGHSLLATQVISQIRSIFNVDLALRSLFEAPTIAGLAENIQDCLNIEHPQTSVVEMVTRNGSLPLSFAQQRLWFLDRLLPDGAIYNMSKAFRVTGPFNVKALQQSLNEIIRRHQALRTIFVDEQEQPLQRIIPFLHLELPVIDLQDGPGGEIEAELNRHIGEEVRRPFDLRQGPLLRANLFRLDQEDHVLLVVLHHIITDGWSMGVFFRELGILYEAYINGKDSPLQKLPIQYADFTVWQRRQSDIFERQLHYWKKQLDSLGVLELTTDRPRPPMQTYCGDRESFVISTALTEALVSLSRDEQVTLFMTLLAAFQALLYRYTDQEDIAVGSPIANRNRIEIEGLIGFFVNTLVLRSDLSGNPTFRELLGSVRNVALDAYVNQDIPFEKLVEELQPERNLSINPLFQVMFILQNAPGEQLQLPGLTMEPLAVETGTAKFDMSLFMTETDGELQGRWEYNTDLFDRPTIMRMIDHFLTLLEGITANPDETLNELPLLTGAERNQLLIEWNSTETDYPRDACIHELFESQVEKTPNTVALVFNDEQLTYRELNERAEKLAHYLQRRGVGPEVVVGICLERSLEMVIGLMGILKAGGAYVPLDPEYPAERLSFMAEDARIQLLLTQAHLPKALSMDGLETVYLDSDWPGIDAEVLPQTTSRVRAENLAYVIYTSGSTGHPKGVAMEHRPLYNLIFWQIHKSPLASPRTLQFAPLSFDVSFQEIFSTLCCGGTLVLISDELRKDPEALINTLHNELIERLFLPFAALQLLANASNQQESMLPNLREVIVAGEQLQLSPTICAWFKGLPNCILENQYGPSEGHVVTSFILPVYSDTWPLLPPIGRPINNCKIYLLDGQLQPVPVGIPGDLYIGGENLARGYLNRPELNAEKFIADPISSGPGARLYKTGDLARYLPDGTIEFLGRVDHQVKVRGFRIELGEIESVLSQHPSVTENVVVAQEADSGDKRLVAYVVSNSNGSLTTSEYRRLLSEKLPEYMIPSQFVILDQLPLTPSGKVDRRSLPAPDRERPDLDQGFTAPRTRIEEKLAAIWADLLDLDQVGIHDNFFDLGGHSLLATQVVSRMQKIMNIEIQLRILFECPTIAQQTEYLENIHNTMEKIKPTATTSSEDREEFEF